MKTVPATSFGGRLIGSGLLLAVLLTLAACDHPDNGLTKEDYRDLATRMPPAPAGGAQARTEPPIPELQPILAAPPPPALEQRLVSVNVPDPDVPLRDVLIELARKVGVDLDLDPKITGGVIIYAKDRPFAEVIDRICDMANLRYSFKNNVLRVEIDTMYVRGYRVSLPNAIRSAKMNVATSTDVFSAVQGGSAGGGNNSTSSVENDSTNDAWKDIEDNLKQILINSYPKSQPIDSNVVGNSGQQTATVSPTASGQTAPAPKAAGAVPAPPGVPVATPGGQGNAPAAPATGAQGAAVPPSNFSATNQSTSNQAADQTSGGTENPGATAGTVAAPSSPLSALANLAQLQQNLINQATGQGAPAPAVVAPPVGVANGASTPQAFFSINRTAGIVSVFGTGKQHKLVQEYLSHVVAEASSQVLIEAKVVEVDLNDQFKSGIDWQRAISAGGGSFSFGTQPSGSTGFLGDQTNFAKQVLSGATSNAFTLSWNGTSFSSLMNFVEGFGTTRTLSSPRITAINNQTAVLKVAQNQVYFSLQSTITPSTVAGVAPTATYTSTLHTVPIGVVMTVQPVINTDANTVTLNLRPTVSVHSGDVADPGVALALAAACTNSSGTNAIGACSSSAIAQAETNSNVPIVEVREMDSVVTVPSGEIVVMGGLMQSNSQKQNTAIPGAGDIPLIGNLFKVQSHETDVTELVIFLKASIVHGSDTVDWADKDLYKRYIQDPRPLAF